MTRKISINLNDKVFDAIEKVQRDELKKGNKVSINKIANNWIMYYLGYDVKNYYPENWEKI